jgi:hypothetical protein
VWLCIFLSHVVSRFIPPAPQAASPAEPAPQMIADPASISSPTQDVAMVESSSIVVEQVETAPADNSTAMDDSPPTQIDLQNVSIPVEEVTQDSLDASCDLFMDVSPRELNKRQERDADTSRSPISKARSRRPSRSRTPPKNRDNPVSCSCGQVFTHIRQIRSHFKAKKLCSNEPFINCRCEKLTLEPSSHEKIRDLFYEHIESECQL